MNTLKFNKCCGRVSDKKLQLNGVSRVGSLLYVWSAMTGSEEFFHMTVDLDRVLLTGDNFLDPYGCDPLENRMYYVPPNAFLTSSMPSALEGFLDMASEKLHVDAVDQDDLSYFWLDVFGL